MYPVVWKGETYSELLAKNEIGVLIIHQEDSANLAYGSLLVLRRRVSAKRRTIVFSTVRPSLQQIIELSKKIQVFYTFNGIIRPMNHVRLSVCRHLGALLCTDECSLIPQWILFSFGTWNKHILELCLGVLFLKYLKNCNFGDFLKNGDFGDLA